MKTKLKQTVSKNKNLILLAIITIIAGALRIINLGYSDFQGDEIKALFLPEQNQSIFQFLLDQRKGPLQFVITYFLKFFDPLYQNQFLLRLPFALAGTFATIYFYKLVKNLFNNKIAFFSAFLFATNGFLVAFSRIVQYQSFVILFMIMALYYLQNKKIYKGLVFWALSIMAHYDGIFIFPLAFYFIYNYLTENSQNPINFKIHKLTVKINRQNLKNFVFAGLIAVAILASFYVPFVLNISSATQDYWLGRITGDVSTKLSSSMYLFTVYQPIYVVHIYLALFALGITALLYSVSQKIPQKFKIAQFVENILKKIKMHNFVKTISFATNPEKNHFKPVLIVFAWFLVAILFMEVLVYIPGTHIYTYIIPATIFASIGLVFVEKAIVYIFKTKLVFAVPTVLVLLFIFLQSFAVFVENKQEYPWEEEKFLIWTFPKPTPIFHLSMFGFPYFRNWEEIAKYIQNYPQPQQAYSTNERESITRYHIKLPKSTDEAGFFVHVRNPQSFEDRILNKKAFYWAENNKPVYVYERNGKNLVNIYLMKQGKLEDIR